MSKYSKTPKVSEKTEEEALQIARATQRPGQTKDQTKLIYQGIKKGIEQYKKKYKEKSRELDKKLNKVKANKVTSETPAAVVETVRVKVNLLPWVLLVLSWGGFATYFFIFV